MYASGDIRRWRRRGLTSQETLLLVAACAIAGTVGVTVAPRVLSGAAPVLADRPPAPPEARRVYDAVRGVFAAARDVLDIDDRPGESFSVVLWHTDNDHPGSVDPHEVAVLEHSVPYGTITALYRPADDASGEAAGGTLGLDVEIEEDRRLQGSTYRAEPPTPPSGVGRRYVERWRRDPQVRRAVLGAGVASLRVAPVVGPGGEAGIPVVRVTLTWASPRPDAGGSDTGVEGPRGVFDWPVPEPASGAGGDGAVR